MTRAPGDDTDSYLPDHGDRSYSVDRYDLDLDYRVEGNHLTGRAAIALTTNRRVGVITFDLATLRVQKVTVNGRRPGRYVHRSGKLRITLAAEVRAGTPLRVEVHYAGRPRLINGTWGEVGWEELSDGVIVAGEPNGAPSWFPCNDRPDDKAAYTITVTTDSAYHVVANGTLAERRVRASRTTWVHDQPEPMATYLATVQIGRYEPVVVASRPVPQYAAIPSRLRRNFHVDFGRQPEMMALFEELFGPYPFRSYGIVVTDDPLEIPLEAQGLSVFGANHVDGRNSFERLVAHELAHQWFGNCLTLARWRDVWLHEGFACYAEWLWSERAGGPSADEHARTAWRRLRALRQDLVIANPGPELMFDDRLYKRGALTLHALRRTLGDERFFDTLRSWVAEHRYGSVTTAGFTAVVAGADADTVELLDAWLHRPELPPLPDAR